MISVIDIGTNTIRAVQSDGDYELANYSERSTILENTQSGILTNNGIEDLTAKLKGLLAKLDTKPYVFATSAFRSLDNQSEVCTYIKEELGIDIEILSGEDEAECDYISMKYKIGEVVGVGADLGGGSCQIFSFNGKLENYKSLHIGVKRLQAEFVADGIPSLDERTKIKKYLNSVIKFDETANTLYVMGGTARAMLKLRSAIKDNAASEFTIEELESIADFAMDSTMLPIIKNILPKRYDSIGIGIDVLCVLAEKVGAKMIKVVDCSVREGYLIKKQQKNP